MQCLHQNKSPKWLRDGVLNTKDIVSLPKMNWSLLMGAAFLMATSAIGPGFLTQTTVFTQTLAASFGFVILVSIIFDIFAQTNIWRIIAVSERRGQDIANMVFPGLGYILSFLIVLGGLAFTFRSHWWRVHLQLGVVRGGGSSRHGCSHGCCPLATT